MRMSINKIVKFDNRDNFKVAGVFEDFPKNSVLYGTKLLLPWKKFITAEFWLKNATTQWNFHSFQSFVQLADHIEIQKETEKIKNIVSVHKAATDQKEQALLFSDEQMAFIQQF